MALRAMIKWIIWSYHRRLALKKSLQHPIGTPKPNFQFCGAISAELVQRCKYKLRSQHSKNMGFSSPEIWSCQQQSSNLWINAQWSAAILECILTFWHSSSCSKKGILFWNQQSHTSKWPWNCELPLHGRSNLGALWLLGCCGQKASTLLRYQQVPAKNPRISGI